MEWIVVLSAVLIIALFGFIWFRSRGRKRPEEVEPPEPQEIAAEAPLEALRPEPVQEVAEERAEPKKAKPAEPTLADRLFRTRGTLFGRLEKLLKLPAKQAFTRDEWEVLEEALLEADVGVQTVGALMEQVKEKAKSGNEASLQQLIQEGCEEILGDVQSAPFSIPDDAPRPFVISVIGVNGVGKTTTIGKIAHRLYEQKKSVLLGATDTFRAAAISQLKIWADRVEAQFVAGREGGDPGAVAFDSVSAGKARGIDVVLLDTAGRLHTKGNLMEELKKIHRVTKKVVAEAPHETWLILDGTIGQNSIHQAREFQKALDITGLIITKLDGTAKGGAVLGIVRELKLPIYFIGVGETVNDLIPFDSKTFVEAIFG